MSYMLKQPIPGGIQPVVARPFGTEDAAEKYKNDVIKRLKTYLAIRLAGTPVGNKEPADLERELEQANAWEVIEA